MSNPNLSPIFIHSLFRAGSTYMFNVFRQTGNFVCFQEALHEISYLARESPEQLLSLSGTGESQRELRHPALDKPYFFELHSRHSYWKDIISPSAIFDAAFPESDQASTVKFFDALIKSSGDKPSVFQECRTPLRIEGLKAALKGTHIYLSRNPLGQWWSQKTTPYFEIANRMFIDATDVPPSVELLKNRIGFQSSPQVDLIAKYQFHKSHLLTYEHQFEVFLLLWSLGEIQAHNHADIRVDMDVISENADVRNKLVRQFEGIGIQDVDLSNCNVPAGLHSNDEIQVLTEKAVIVLDILKASGSSSADIALVEKAIELAVKRSKSNLAKGDASHSAKLKAMYKSQHKNSLQLLNEARGARQAIEATAEAKEKAVQALQSEKASIFERLSAAENDRQYKEKELAALLAEKSRVEDDSRLKDKEFEVLLAEKSRVEDDSRLKEKELAALLTEKSRVEDDSRLKDKELEVLLTAKSALEYDQQLKAKKIATILSEKHALFLEYEDRENTIQQLTIKQAKQKSVSTKLRKDIRQYKNQKAELISHLEELDAAHRNFIAVSSDVQTHLKENNSNFANDLALKEANLKKALTAGNEREIHVETLDEMVAHLSAVINNKDEQITAIKATTSWRITAPLRVIRGGISFNDKIKSKGLAAIRFSPLFKSLVLMFLLPFPRIKARLESYAKESETLDSLVETTDHLPKNTHEDHWNLIPTLPNTKKWQVHFKRSK